MQDALGLVQDFHHGQDPFIETLLLYALGSIIEREEYRHRVLRIRLVEQWLALRG